MIALLCVESNVWVFCLMTRNNLHSTFCALGLLDILSGDMQKGIKIQTKHLDTLIELHNTTGTFARNVQHLFSDSDIQVLMDVLKAVFLPYESFKQR